ncbi:MAG: YkgJ family cysteine cluster protein [Firmicutes bacterium]|nr:YkgJ family cysteine cluster protein [Bacillota bacterium]
MTKDKHFKEDEKFNFSCHEGLACFNTCCKDISIFLTPYDLLRLKNKLKITSQELLDKYTKVVNAGSRAFPMVIINMKEDDDKKCPFVTGQGCNVYLDRPWSCRMAPVDIKGEGSYGFCFESDYCHGLNEQQEWTVSDWAKNQGADIYQKMDEKFKEIPEKLQFTGFSSIDRHIKEMFFMACYNLDKFKKYIFNTSFLEKFAVPPATAEKIKNDEVELMKFGFRWLMNFDVRKSMEIRDELEEIS